MIEKDLIVIGVGMAGNTAANKCASAGWSVAVIDELPYGGTCALRGCDPKKILRRGAEIIDAARLMRGKGVDENGLAINWSELMAHKRAFTDKMPGRIEGGLEKNGGGPLIWSFTAQAACRRSPISIVTQQASNGAKGVAVSVHLQSVSNEDVYAAGDAAATQGALMTPMLAARFEKHHLMIGMNVFHARLLMIGYSITPDQYALTVIFHTAGIFTFGVVITLLFSMYTDCVEYGEWSTGNNSAGLTVLASMFSLKFGSAVGGAMPGLILAGFGFGAHAVQSETAITGIRLMFMALPAAFFLSAGCSCSS